MPQKLSDRVLTILDRAVSEPTAPPSPINSKRQAVADLNAEIAALQTELGLPHTMPVWNLARGTSLVAKLQAQVAAKNATPAPAAASPAAATATGEPEILTATLAQFKAMDAATRLQFAQDNGALSHADFSALSSAAKMMHCRNGCQVLADRRHRCTAA